MCSRMIRLLGPGERGGGRPSFRFSWGAVVPQLDGRLIAEQGDKEQEKGIEQVQQHQGQPSEAIWLDVKPAGGQE